MITANTIYSSWAGMWPLVSRCSAVICIPVFFPFTSRCADVQKYKSCVRRSGCIVNSTLPYYPYYLDTWATLTHKISCQTFDKMCLYCTFWNVKTIALALKLNIVSIVSQSGTRWWSTPVIPLLGHLRELEMNWFRTSTKNHQNTSWFKNIEQK